MVPELSVVIIAGKQRQRVTAALASILSQAGIQRAEVILIDTCSPGLPPVEGYDHPGVRMVEAPQGLSMGELRALGARLGRGQIVAFLEEHSRALPGWLEATIAAFDTGWAGAGGEVHIPNSGVGISDTLAMMNYPAWRPPARAGESELLPGHNSAYQREILLSFGDELGSLLLSEVLLQWKLNEQGYRLGIDPRIKFGHINETTLASISKGYFFWHRCFGHSRAHYERWNVLQTALRVLSVPLIPAVRATKLMLYLAKERPYDLRLFLRTLPAILVAQSFSALGMAAGYLFGIGKAEGQITRYELEEERQMA
jgi:glycosyltransferase involved in cell wall biosynthesis